LKKKIDKTKLTKELFLIYFIPIWDKMTELDIFQKLKEIFGEQFMQKTQLSTSFSH